MFRFNFEQKITNMIRYGYLTSRETDEERNQIAQIGFLGRKIPCRIIQPYGLTTGAPRGSEMIVFSIGALSNNQAGIPTYPQNRKKGLKEWEVVLSNQNKQSELFFDEEGNIHITTPEKNINISAEEDINIDSKNTNINSTENINIQCLDLNINCENLNIQASGSVTITAGGQTLQISSSGIVNNGVNIGSDHKHDVGDILDGDNRQCTGTSGEPI